MKPAQQISRLLFCAGAAVALSHLADEWVKLAPPWGPAWKAAGIVLLGLFAFSRGAALVGAALLLCALGDVFLEYDGLFVAGMAAFGAGHIVYILCFLEWRRVLGVNKRDFPLAFVIAAISVSLLIWFLPDMGALLIPGILYQAIITLMVCAAMLAKAPMLARLGAVVFMVSDSLIALGLYKNIDVLPGSVWLTYAIAQISMAWGLTKIVDVRKRAKPA